MIQVDSLSPRYNGIYTIMDTGPSVQGRELDIYMWSCHEALVFGRRGVAVNVLRLGWNPRASSASSNQSEIRSREQHLQPEVGNPSVPIAPPSLPAADAVEPRDQR